MSIIKIIRDYYSGYFHWLRRNGDQLATGAKSTTILTLLIALNIISAIALFGVIFGHHTDLLNQDISKVVFITFYFIILFVCWNTGEQSKPDEKKIRASKIYLVSSILAFFISMNIVWFAR